MEGNRNECEGDGAAGLSKGKKKSRLQHSDVSRRGYALLLTFHRRLGDTGWVFYIEINIELASFAIHFVHGLHLLLLCPQRASVRLLAHFAYGVLYIYKMKFIFGSISIQRGFVPPVEKKST